jgi:DNA-directed RNA polymerase sigma subunit (sigma70/sigma32)
MPARFLEFASQVDRVQAKLEQSLGRAATTSELAEAMKTRVRTLEASLGILRSTVSLSATQDQDDEAPITRLVSPDTADGDTISRLNREQVRNALRTLRPNDREIVTRMFGINGHPPETLSQVAARLGITSEYVRQRKNAALQSLKFIFKKHPL